MFFSASLCAYFFIDIIPFADDVSMIELICHTFFSLMLFLMDVLFIITSKTPILVFLSAVLTSVCDCMPSSTSLSLSATLPCISGGKNDMYLLMVSAADCVWSVEKTTCHDSASMSTDSAVSLSRISHTKIMSGSSRRDHLSALANDRVSCPISLCEMRHFCGVKINSIGSSTVIMFSVLFSLICSSIAMSEVLLPDPVAPVTRNSHFFALRMCFLMESAISANMRSSIFLASRFIFLMTIPTLPVLRNALTLYGTPDLET